MVKEGLTKKQIDFLRAINNTTTKNLSISRLGKNYYKTYRSVNLTLEIFRGRGLVELEKGWKELIVTITPKGRRLILK